METTLHAEPRPAPKTKTVNGPRGKITLIFPEPNPPAPKSKQDNPKHNPAKRRSFGKPVRQGITPLWHGYKRRDGAMVIRVIGRDQAKAMKCRYYEAQMSGAVGGKRRKQK